MRRIADHAISNRVGRGLFKAFWVANTVSIKTAFGVVRVSHATAEVYLTFSGTELDTLRGTGVEKTIMRHDEPSHVLDWYTIHNFAKQERRSTDIELRRPPVILKNSLDKKRYSASIVATVGLRSNVSI